MSKVKNIKINLLYYKFEKEREERKKIIEYGWYAALVFLLVTGVYIMDFYNEVRLNSLKAINQDLETRYQQISSSAPAAPRVVYEDMASIEQRKKLLTSLEKEKIECSTLIEEIYTTALPEVIISEIQVSNDDLTLHAYAAEQLVLIEFLAKLEENPRIKEISQVDSQFAAGEFKCSISLRWGEDSE
ncbi:MAG: hypothetical protein GX550_08895 [Syntrophomonadaceae bacterium]|nr:hypothetical protein [Syntrophomonadaceae bacterium]